MSETAITIRMAEEGDAEALLAIYAPYVEKQPSPLNIRCPLSGNLKTASPPP